MNDLADKARRVVELSNLIEQTAEHIASTNGCTLETINREKVRRDRCRDGVDNLELSFETKGLRGRVHTTLCLDTDLAQMLDGSHAHENAVTELVAYEIESACVSLTSLAAIPADIKAVDLGRICPIHPHHLIVGMDLDAWKITCSTGPSQRRHSFLMDRIATHDGHRYSVVERPKDVSL